MKYTISEIIKALGLKSHKIIESTITILLTDSRKISNPEETLFFAIQTNTNDGHLYIEDLYFQGVQNFVVSSKKPEWSKLPNANFLWSKIRF